jgi:hypothetical protein
MQAAANGSKQAEVESQIWASLRLDDLTDEMTKSSISFSNTLMAGSGFTHNACEVCSGSLTTSGSDCRCN